MLTPPNKVDLNSALEYKPGKRFWLSDSLSNQVSNELKQRSPHAKIDLVCFPGSQEPDDCNSLVAIGGGKLLDLAKQFKMQQRCHSLIAIPSIWGSGAEVSAIVVTRSGQQKHIEINENARPDAYSYWPELAKSLTPRQKLAACGDVWAHVLEAFLSPIASPDIQRSCATLIEQILNTPDASDLNWFRWSSAACDLQSRASVGLIHGLAHVIEYPFSEHSRQPAGHARLCALFLAPVLQFNLSQSEKAKLRFESHNLNLPTIMTRLCEFYDEQLYLQVKPYIIKLWKKVLRDPCTRTNVSLVRRNHLESFLEIAERVKTRPNTESEKQR